MPDDKSFELPPLALAKDVARILAIGFGAVVRGGAPFVLHRLATAM